ncbi:MAG TPA: hypothetical protein VMT95_02330 [Candidatus Binatia bacterium]|nr:hypothetical protein [Candidatus Binatia bacterium]
MPTSFLTIRYLLGSFAAAAAVALIAGCGGSSSPMTPLGSAPQQGPAVKGHCTPHGGVRVHPCTITFNASNPGPDTVTVRTPIDEKGSLQESDNCGGASGIATLAPGTGKQWTVTAGPTTGSCTASFIYLSKRGKTLGYAQLSITNDL